MELALATATARSATLEDAVVRYREPLARRLAMIVRDPESAADLAQSACLRALERREAFDGRDARAWLYAIGINLALNHVRRRRLVVELRLAEAAPEWTLETDPDLWAALGELDPRTRSALLLHTLDGYTHAEIGALLGAPEGTVASWLSRARARLRDRLADAR